MSLASTKVQINTWLLPKAPITCFPPESDRPSIQHPLFLGDAADNSNSSKSQVHAPRGSDRAILARQLYKGLPNLQPTNPPTAPCVQLTPKTATAHSFRRSKRSAQNETHRPCGILQLSKPELSQRPPSKSTCWGAEI